MLGLYAVRLSSLTTCARVQAAAVVGEDGGGWG
jgi:hypothetical protein